MRSSEFVVLLFISLIFTMANVHGYSQQQSMLLEHETELKNLGLQVWKPGSDSIMISSNSIFKKKLEEALRVPGAYAHPFDSLKQVSRLKSSDSRFRIWTWNLPLSDGTFRYHGIIETREGRIISMESGKQERCRQDDICSPETWYGAIYYALIERKYGKNRIYTLLGWDGCDLSSDRKIIDVISFNSKGMPSFGGKVFKTPDGIRNRVVIDYAEKANALLRYDKQTLLIDKGSRVRKSREWMIVADRLIPRSPSLTGIRKYYVPSGDTYDAYIFRDGYWIFAEDISVSNPSSARQK